MGLRASVWLKGDVLGCDLCPEKLDVAGDKAAVIMRGRARGWKQYDGPTQGGDWLSTHLCPKCAQVARVKPPEVLEGQEELF